MKRLPIILLSLLALCSCKRDRMQYCIEGQQFTVQFFSPRIAHVSVAPEGAGRERRSLAVARFIPEKCRVRESDDFIEAFSESLKVEIDKSNGFIRFYDGKGKLLLTDKGRVFADHRLGDGQTYLLRQTFLSQGSEALYGLGGYQDCHSNYRGKSARLVQANMDIVNPYLVTTGGYAILWDNYSATDFCDDGKQFSFTSEVADAADYYIVAGECLDELVSGYRQLTGDVPMFPRSAYGFWQSKERYRSFDELEEVVRQFRQRRIPLDNIVQDWEYWGDKPHWNSMRFDAPGFAGAPERIADLHKSGNVNLMLSVWPGFGPETDIYKEMETVSGLFDEATWAGYKVFDAFNPLARDIFWEHLEPLLDTGVDALWLDATEPSFRDGFTQDGQEARSKAAGMTYLGLFDRYLNAYSLEMMKDLYPRLRERDSERRVFILTRSAFASQQRYAAAVWSGDISASWEVFHKQLVAGLNVSLTGIPYWTSDIGGFYVFGREGQFPRGLEDEEYKELYARWFQFGAFNPLFRSHGTDVPREPWQFGEEGDIWYDNQVKYIKLRYALLPYIYSVAHAVTSDGYTFMRHPAMDFPSDSTALNVNYAYMFGPAFYVRPVFCPVSKQTVVETYLPQCEGGIWYEFESSAPCAAASVHTSPSRCDCLPLFVRAGSIIPMTGVKQWADEHKDSSLEIAVYAGADGHFVWYDDEGDSYRYEQGLCSEVSISWDDAARTLTFADRKGRYPGMPEQVQMNITLHLADGSSVSQTIQYDNSEISVRL